MDTLTALLSWFLIHTIFGVFALCGLLYVVLSGLKRRFPQFPEPAFVVVPFFLIGIVVLPSIPRYQFERKTLAQIEGKGWIRVVNTTRWGDITEPLTWVKTPIGSVTIIMPQPIEKDTFRQVVMQYEQKPVVSLVDVQCETSTIIYSEPDAKGVVRYTTPSPVKMTPLQKTWFCDYDWTREKEALRTEYLRQADQGKKR